MVNKFSRLSRGDERMSSEIMQLIKDLEETLEIMNKKREEALLKIQKLYEQLVNDYNNTRKKVGRLAAITVFYLGRILRFIKELMLDEYSIDIKDIVTVYDVDEKLNIKLKELRLIRILIFEDEIEVEYEDNNNSNNVVCYQVPYKYEIRNGLLCLQFLLSEKVLRKIISLLEEAIEKLERIEEFVKMIEKSEEIELIRKYSGG